MSNLYRSKGMFMGETVPPAGSAAGCPHARARAGGARGAVLKKNVRFNAPGRQTLAAHPDSEPERLFKFAGVIGPLRIRWDPASPD